MKKKFLPVLVLLALSMVFAGCVFEVEGEVVTKGNQAAKPGKPTATPGTDTYNGTPAAPASFVVLTWEAAKDADNYNIYFRREGTKTIMGAPVFWQPANNSGPTNTITYLTTDAPVTPTQANGYTSRTYYTTNANPDIWTARINVTTGPAAGDTWIDTGAVGVRKGQTVRFGVATRSLLPNQTVSDIVWSDPITLP